MIRSAMITRGYASDVAFGDSAEQKAGQERLGQLDAITAMMQELTAENDRLRAALGFKERNKLYFKGAGVRYYGTEFGHEFLLVESKNLEGVEKGSLVIDANGLLIGSVKDIQDSYVKIGIASNPEEVYEVILLPSGTNAFAKGLGNRTFSLELISQDAIIRKGDFIVLKSEYKTVVAGEVIKIVSSGTGAFKEIRATLLSHPDFQEEVFIISK